MNLGQILEYLHPGIRLMPGPNADALLEDTGDGPRIVMWNLPDPPPTEAELEAMAAAAAEAALLAGIRAERDRLLIASDWTEGAPHLTRPQRKQWQIYRQKLRDITAQDPNSLTWPTPPHKTAEYDSYEWLVQLPLAEAKEWARQEVNDQAGNRRAFYGTDIPFQSAIYLRKQSEIQGPMPDYPITQWPGFLNDPAPDATKYPILYQEAAGRGIAPETLAQEYKANADLWPQLMAAIEAVRLPIGNAIKAAQDHQTVIDLITDLTWPV